MPPFVHGISRPTVPEGILAGIELFNRGEFFAAHEVMEHAWRITPGEERLLYQGMIQAAVAMWRVQRGNAAIALTMCARGLPKLALFRPAWGGIDVEALFHALLYVRDQALAGEEHIRNFDPRQYPRIRMVGPGTGPR